MSLQMYNRRVDPTWFLIENFSDHLNLPIHILNIIPLISGFLVLRKKKSVALSQLRIPGINYRRTSALTNSFSSSGASVSSSTNPVATDPSTQSKSRYSCDPFHQRREKLRTLTETEHKKAEDQCVNPKWF